MISVTSGRTRKEKDSTVALINIVFLMLVFFLIAGTIVPPLDSEVSAILSKQEKNAQLENTLSVRADGQIWHLGEPITPQAFVSQQMTAADDAKFPVRVLADRALPAPMLVDVINELQAAGAGSVLIITERKEQ